MNNLNKITHTRVGDNIHYFTNGQEGRGTVVKMNNAYVSVLKDSGVIDEIHINDTFFIKDIITNKSWNDMDLEERVVELQKAHAFSPRFISKTWEELPKELQEILTKSNLEESTHGQIGGNRAGVSTKTPFDADEDYEGESDDRDKQTKEEFKHEHQEKPKVEKNNGMEKEHKKKEHDDGMRQDWRPTGGESDKNKGLINKYVAPTNRRVAPRADTVGWQSMIQANAPKKKEPKAISDENTEYRSTTGKLLGRGAEGKRLQEEDLNKSSWETWLSLTQKGHNPFKVKYDVDTAKENLNQIFADRKAKKQKDKKIHGALGTASTDKFKALKDWLEAKKMGEIRHRDGSTTSFDSKFDDSVNTGLKYHNQRGGKGEDGKPKKFDPTKDSVRFDGKTGKFLGNRPERKDLKHTPAQKKKGIPTSKLTCSFEEKQRKLHEHGVKTGQKFADWHSRNDRINIKPNPNELKNPRPETVEVNETLKEGDGAGNSGINSTDTVGVYNARYSDRKGRYRDQGKDGKQ